MLKNYYRFQEDDHRALNQARDPLELGALCNLCAARPGSRRDPVQGAEACISASPFLAPSQLGLSQRSALNSPSSVNCSPPSTFAPHLRLSVCSVYIVMPRKSYRHRVLKGLTQGDRREAPRVFPVKAALLPLSRTSTSSPTMGFSLSLSLTKSFIILLQRSRPFFVFRFFKSLLLKPAKCLRSSSPCLYCKYFPYSAAAIV